MEYGPSDSSGTDDDLPPSYQNRSGRGGPRVSGNGRAIAGASQYQARGAHTTDMETQIHQLEQEAYTSVLRAFKAQSDAITWEKESLITELRKELRVSDKEHRELLSRVNADDIIRRIREWRQAGGAQAAAGMISGGGGGVQQGVHEAAIPSPTVSASRKRQKTSQPLNSLSLPQSVSAAPPSAASAGPPPALLAQPQPPSMQPSSSAVKKGGPPPPPLSKGKKPKSKMGVAGKQMQQQQQQYGAGPSGRGGPPSSRANNADVAAGGEAQPSTYDPLIGRKVMTRWPEDNNFYQAVITDYNHLEGLHALVYDINTPNETWEWVNLKEISPEDIKWEGEDPGINQRPGRGGPKKSTGRGGAHAGGGRGRGSIKNNLKKDNILPPSQNGIGKRSADNIEILHTETLIKEVERVFNASHPDPLEIEKAKKVLKEHEQSLMDAIARLAEASDGESGGGGGPMRNYNDDTAIDGDLHLVAE